MLPLNVSFGIYAFLPMGWLFMAFIILGEAFLMSRYLIRKSLGYFIFSAREWIGVKGLLCWR